MVNMKEIEYFFSLYKDRINIIINLFEIKYGVKNPIKIWRNGLIPRTGYLDINNKTNYSLHGFGCTVEFDNGEIVSFDFSDNEIINIDAFKFELFLQSISKINVKKEELNAVLAKCPQFDPS